MSEQVTTTLTPGHWLIEKVDVDVLALELADEQLDMLRNWFGRLPPVALAYDQQPVPEALAANAPTEFVVVEPTPYVQLEVALGRCPNTGVRYATLQYDEGTGAPNAPAQYLFGSAEQAGQCLDFYPAPELP